MGVLGLLDAATTRTSVKPARGEAGGQLVSVHHVMLSLDVGTPSGLVQKLARAMLRRSTIL
jgi:hypothetical protein